MDPLRAAANWYPDPLGRGEYRYWDGERWTQWIATGGAQRADPIELPPGLPQASQLSKPGTAETAPARPFGYTRFRSLTGLATALSWLLGVAIIGAVALAIACGNRISKLDALEHNPDFSRLDDFHSADDAVSTTSTVLTVISLAVLVVLIIFLFRASSNTEFWAAWRRTWAPGWTIG